jgi:hypothetical protein
VSERPVDRRRFLLAAGGLAGSGLVLGACGGSSERPADDQPVVTRPDRLEGDLSVAALLASLENLLVWAYKDAIDRKDRFGPYPPAVMGAIEAAQSHHRDHAVAWNSILTGAGKPGVTGVNLTVKSTSVEPVLNRTRDTSGLLNVCHELETITSATYLNAVGVLTNNAAIKVAAAIHPVENQHLGVLAFLLGRNLDEDSFGHTDGARPLTDAIG